MMPVSSWGRLSAYPHDIVYLVNAEQVPGQIASSRPGIAHGMGRSYGDACLNPGGVIWKTSRLDYLIRFDEVTGRLTCESGVLLGDIQRLFIPQGWMLPVTPGTQMVTVGGAIANDVHGKNHHKQGTFGDHVQRIKLVRTDGEIIECGPEFHRAWFAATIGGLGLTGVIIEAEIQMKRIAGPWLETETVPYADTEEFLKLADESVAEWEHTVSWVDCISGVGRGLFMRGRPAEACERPPVKSRKLTMPMVPPVSLVNRLSLRLFNSVYFNLKKRQKRRAIEYYEPFFYPLDNLLEWNRIYGPKGFFQYQSVVPRDVGKEAIRAMLKETARAGDGSFLAVLKTFGNRQPSGMLSFPRPGVTIALDFSNRGARTLKLFERLDAVVREAGGRIYPAKDARMPRDLFEAGYPRLNEFLKYRDTGISSALSRRLMGS